MFADTDFILAAVKDSDWLRSNAAEIFEEIEVALMCKKLNLNILEI